MTIILVRGGNGFGILIRWRRGPVGVVDLLTIKEGAFKISLLGLA